MHEVRIGVIGVGNMGSFYADCFLQGKIERAAVTALCNPHPHRLEDQTDVPTFRSSDELLDAGLVDAVVIATPHYFHTTIGQDALNRGLHVLVDKPISVHKADAERLIAAHRNPEQIFAAMFNQRTDRRFQKIKSLIDEGALGTIRRINWIVTDWFRTQIYYTSNTWRATWSGEGGGVLLNQCPHQLDMLCHLFGLPARVEAHCFFGKYHHIEVEDDVTAYLEYPDGATGVFIASTGETPGTNRLEITGESGRILLEQDRFDLTLNEQPATEFSRCAPESFGRPKSTTTALTGLDHGGQHVEILRNFVGAILDRSPLIAPAAEGLASVELANAMLMSTFTNQPIDLPIDAAAYERLLKKKIEESTFEKSTIKPGAPADVSASFKNP